MSAVRPPREVPDSEAFLNKMVSRSNFVPAAGGGNILDFLDSDFRSVASGDGRRRPNKIGLLTAGGGRKIRFWSLQIVFLSVKYDAFAAAGGRKIEFLNKKMIFLDRI